MCQIRYLVIYSLLLIRFIAYADNFCEIFGQLIDKDNKGISGAKIVLNDKYYRTTDKWGFFNFDIIKKGIYNIKVYYSGKLIITDSMECFSNWNTITLKFINSYKDSDNLVLKKDIVKLNSKTNNKQILKQIDNNKNLNYWEIEETEKFKNEYREVPYFLEKENTKKELKDYNNIFIIEGIIKDRMSGKLLEGVFIECNNTTAITNIGGYYRLKFKATYNEKVTVRIGKPGYKDIEIKIILNNKNIKLEHLLEPEEGGDIP